MKSFRKKFWIAGILTAASGIILARVVPDLLTQPPLKFASYLFGVTLALAGLAILVLGMRRADSR